MIEMGGNEENERQCGEMSVVCSGGSERLTSEEVDISKRLEAYKRRTSTQSDSERSWSSLARGRNDCPFCRHGGG